MIHLITDVSHRVYRWLTFGWTLIILYLTLSEPTTPDDWLSQIPHFDKAAHFGIFFVWSIFLSLCYQKHPFKGFLPFSITLLAGMLLGFITEYLQAYIPGRSSDPLDFIFDMLGIGVGLVFTFTIKKNE